MDDHLLEKIANILQEKNHFIILGHINPDGDCIGSMFALKWLLDKLGKECLILLESPLTKFDFLIKRGGNDYKLFTEFNSNYLNWPNTNFITLDAGDMDRLGDGKEILDNNFILNLDHHEDNPEYGDFNYVNPDMAAVGEIIYYLADNLDLTINNKIGTAISTAIIADTGGLQYENTSPEVLKIIASLMEKGIDIYQINRHIFGKYPFNRIKLKGLALSNLKITPDNKIAWLSVDKNMLNKTKTDEKDTSGLVNYARDIKGVEVGICFTALEDEKTKVSLRSNHYCPVNNIAASFYGGGHPRAAGCIIDQELNNSINAILDEVKKFV